MFSPDDVAALAIADAHADVITFHREYGLLAVLDALDAPQWEDSARECEQARLAMVPPDLWEHYYRTYGAQCARVAVGLVPRAFVP